ncbi:MAG: AmmeMemoRadiSam system protein B [Pseudomonadota bacterium]
MNKRHIFHSMAILAVIAMLLALIIFGSQAQCESKHIEKQDDVMRMPAVSGAFYPADKTALSTMIDGFLEKANSPKAKGKLVALIVPHAGYVFSGQVAAYGFKDLVGDHFDTAILISNSHRQLFDGIAIYPRGRWVTPLGEVSVDDALARKLIDSSSLINGSESAFSGDHTLEVELPFLQKTLKNFKIVPILFGNAGQEDWRILTNAILDNTRDENVLIIASSDLSHYPSYNDAKAADKNTIDGILSGDAKTLEQNIAKTMQKKLPNVVTCACGEDAIKTVMTIAKGMGADDIKLLNSANSGDVSGEKGRVVGYAAIGFFASERPKGMSDGPLNKEEQEKLLNIAKQSVESFVKKRSMPNFEISDPELNKYLGAFVTLKKNGRLRGCIGRFSPTTIPLYQVVSLMAISAATQDMRFAPVEKDELKDLTYEISVLTEPRKIDSWKDVVPGRDGVIVKKGFHSGVFLPQVATEYNMTLEQFLGELCAQKAQLARNCFTEPDVDLYVFTAQVF